MAMAPDVLGDKLKLTLALLEEIGDDMNTNTKTCTCCGLAVRENMDDYQAKQAIEASANRLAKLYEKLYDGAWPGRELAPVVNASQVRRGEPRL